MAITVDEYDGDILLDFDSLIVLNIVTLVITGLFLILVVYLVCFHVFLIRNNTTTYKHIEVSK